MKINTKIKFEENYLPSKRHRIPRIREAEEMVTVELCEIKKENAPIAMVVTDYKSFLDDNGQDQFALKDTSYIAIDNKLYSEKRDMRGALDEGPYTMDQFLKDISRVGECSRSWHGKGREDMFTSLNKFIDSHILIDGVIYEQRNEPRYVVQTFGLGHNYGGTAMFITEHYNPNIGKDRYFSALDRDKAIVYADKVATARGDTDYIGTFDRDINIKVYIPEMVRCNPQAEHGNGNSLLNSLESLVQGSDSVMEAGLLVMSSASAAQFSDTKPPLDNLIQSACGRTDEPHSTGQQSVKDSSLER